MLCLSAAERGHLTVLKWLRANGCPWDAMTCCSAAASGKLKVLQWARANGCEWRRGVCMRVSARHPAVRQWVEEQPDE
jgi:hypothetical protein